jgi:hypothetical protein
MLPPIPTSNLYQHHAKRQALFGFFPSAAFRSTNNLYGNLRRTAVSGYELGKYPNAALAPAANQNVLPRFGINAGVVPNAVFHAMSSVAVIPHEIVPSPK